MNDLLMKDISPLKLLFFLICIPIFFVSQGCSSNKYLQEDETFLYKNTVRIKSEETIKNKGELNSDMETLIKQKQTRVWLGIPRHWFYYQTKDNPDSTWFKRWIFENFAAEPVIYDEDASMETARRMESYLKRRGYLKPFVSYKTLTDRRQTSVTYTADPGKRWYVDTLVFEAANPKIRAILNANADASYLPPGAPVDIQLYEKERTRITRLLQEKGYATFFQNYISPLKADSSGHTMRLSLEVLPPANALEHKVFTIGQIRVYPDVNRLNHLRDSLIGGIHFMMDNEDFYIKPDIILRNIYMKEGQQYTRSAYDKTYRQLSQIEAFKFVSVNANQDSLQDAVMNYDIILTRNKKMGIGGEIELNYSTVSFTQRSLMGLSGNINYNNRNLLRGAEVFNTALETGVEINLRNPDTLINSFNLSFQNSLRVPKFIDPIGLYGLLGGMNGTPDWKFRRRFGDQLDESTSRITAGYSYVRLINFYDYHSFNLEFGYEMQPDFRRRIRIAHAGVDFFSPDFKPAFQEILDANIFLKESFEKQLFTGFLFRNYTYEYTSQPKNWGITYKTFLLAEVSGLEMFLANSLYNSLVGNNEVFGIGKSNPVQFAHYAKFDLDNRWYKTLGQGQVLAFRLATGLAFTYGPYTQQVPYIKQFYLGGPLSVRAWQIRELGPGGYQDTTISPNASLPFYQTGDVKLEASIEYRFDLFWIFKSAIFIDAGNVWTLRKDPQRPNSHLSSDFLSQIAVGTGIGLRMDFQYFVIRLDFGYKLRSPFPVDGEHWLFGNIKNFSLKQLNTNFAIGYPF